MLEPLLAEGEQMPEETVVDGVVKVDEVVEPAPTEPTTEEPAKVDEALVEIEKPPLKFTQKDFEALSKSHRNETRKEREAKLIAETEARVLRELLQAKTSTSTTQATTEEIAQKPIRPREVDYATREDFEKAQDLYEDARDEWRDNERQKVNSIKTQQDKVKEAEASLKAKVAEQRTTGQKAYADFDDVVVNNVDLVATATMAAALIKRPNGHDIIYYLGKNVEESKRLAAIQDPVELAIEIGELSARLKGAVKPATQPTTKAPQPAATVAAKAKVTTPDTSLAGKTQEERMALIEEAARKRRLKSV